MRTVRWYSNSRDFLTGVVEGVNHLKSSYHFNDIITSDKKEYRFVLVGINNELDGELIKEYEDNNCVKVNLSIPQKVVQKIKKMV